MSQAQDKRQAQAEYIIAQFAPLTDIVKQNKKHPITFPTSKSVPTQFSVTPV